jgi:hypothetical protein
MKNTLIQKASILALTLGSFALVTCTTGLLSGQTVKESRNVSAFTGINLSISANVILRQGNETSMEIEADKNVMSIIETEVNGRTLQIKNRDGHFRNLGEVRIYITTPAIEMLSVTGSGDIICETSLSTGDLSINVSGSGEVRLADLKAAAISLVITGSGDIFLTGKGTDNCKLHAVITGSGSIEAEGMEVATSDINITGSGSAKVNVSGDLETNITGSGSVYYKGNPMVNANAVGSGRTRSMN